MTGGLGGVIGFDVEYLIELWLADEKGHAEESVDHWLSGALRLASKEPVAEESWAGVSWARNWVRDERASRLSCCPRR